MNFQINASQWGGAGHTDTLTIDNIILVHLANSIMLTSSANPSASGGSVTFTATVVTNGVTAGNATGQVVFSSAYSGPFSTNTVSGGSATSFSITNLPVGTDLITAIYSGGNYPAGTNTAEPGRQRPVGPGRGAGQSPDLHRQPGEWFPKLELGDGKSENQFAGSFGQLIPSVSPMAAITRRWRLYVRILIPVPTPVSVFGSMAAARAAKNCKCGDCWMAPIRRPIPLTLPANTWQQITIPLSSLGVANKPNCSGFWIQGNVGGAAQPTFYVDDVQLVAAPAPALVHLGVDAGQVLRTVDARQFGLNTATWDGSLGNSTNTAAA